MSIARALSNALSGLSATARGTETVSSNLANIMTPGYARREVALSGQGVVGGVRVDGIIRHVNENLLSEARVASSAQGDAATRAAYLRRAEAVIGLPGEPHALDTALSRMQTALSAAAARPEDELRLAELVQEAANLAGRLNAASREVQTARADADSAIANDVATINTSLETVAYLNRRIAATQAEGHDASALLDERQLVVDRLSAIVPLQQVPRGAGTVALFTREGALLLDGPTPARLGFSPAGLVQPGQSIGDGTLSALSLNGVALSPGQMRLFTGGSLGANFAIRDELAPALQKDLDGLALDLYTRLADQAVDPTLAPGQAGLFTDPDMVAGGPPVSTGLAARLTINPIVDPAAIGQPWKLRSGINQTSPEPVSKSSILVAMGDALNAARSAGVPFEGQASMAMRFATTGARVASARVAADNTVAVTSARLSMLQSRQMADGVDSDAEMQRLLQYEQAYAANARVIKAIDDMINYLLRM